MSSKHNLSRDTRFVIADALYGPGAVQIASEEEEFREARSAVRFPQPLMVVKEPEPRKAARNLKSSSKVERTTSKLVDEWSRRLVIDLVGHGSYSDPLLANPENLHITDHGAFALRWYEELLQGKGLAEAFHSCSDHWKAARQKTLDWSGALVWPLVPQERAESAALVTNLGAILDLLEEKAVNNEAFGDGAKKLALLLKQHSEAAIELIELIQRRERHPRVRWLAIEELAKMRQPPSALVPSLINGLREWDEKTEALALLGAAVALNLLSVPADQHAAIRAALKPRLKAVDLRNLDPVREEMVCQFLATLGSYAEPEDLEVLAPFWGRGATYAVRLASMDAAIRVVRCFPGSPETEKLFDAQLAALARLGSAFIEMIDIPENAAVMLSTMRLLASRLGPEARVLADFARADRSLSRQILQVLTSSTRELMEAGQTGWLETRKSDVEVMRGEIMALAGSGKATLHLEESRSPDTFVREG